MCKERNIVCGNILWYNKIRNNLIVESYANYKIEEMESIIKSFFNSTLCGDIYVKKNEEKYIAVNGQKRLTSINNFLDGKIKYKDKFFVDFSEEEKESLLEDTLCLVFVA